MLTSRQDRAEGARANLGDSASALRVPLPSGPTPAGNNVPGVPSITTPKGGGAIRGTGEKSSVDAATGSVTASIPIRISPARSKFEPTLSLQYSSSSGNSPFGVGWQLSTSSITRKTDKGLPRYRDEDDSDTFMISGLDDLIPTLEYQPDGTWEEPLKKAPPRVVDNVPYHVRLFSPRTGALTSRIERWTDTNTGGCHWRVISGSNVTTIYGWDNSSRLFDPADANPGNPTRIYSWLASRSFDDRGNAILYSYEADDLTSIKLSEPEETRNKSANRYLKSIKYGNTISTFQDPALAQTSWLFNVVLDYGDHSIDAPTPEHQKPWPSRRDPFSVYRSGFEIRTYRLCQRVLLFHNFPLEKDVGADCLVASTDLIYREADGSLDDGVGERRGSFIISATQRSYRRSSTGYEQQSFPPVDFTYSEAVLSSSPVQIDSENLENISSALPNSSIRWVDLYGEGIPGILSQNDRGWMYNSNLGEGKFGPSTMVKSNPSTASLSQLIDLDGDGNLEWADYSSADAGFYKGSPSEWGMFQPFRSRPTVDWEDLNIRFVDLTGDGFPDLMICTGEVLKWYPSLGELGLGDENRLYTDIDESQGPRLVFSDPNQAIFLADMAGDGLLDFVRISRGNVTYWPNMGYGLFGKRIVMENAPMFDSADFFDKGRIRMADIDGSGTTDLLYLNSGGIQVCFNECGNSWTTEQTLSFVPNFDKTTDIQCLDILGRGTTCLVWSSPLPNNARLHMGYMDLMGGTKPHLLTSLINNLGAETRYNYTTSVQCYLRDKLQGVPWISHLPFPVQVVESVETLDLISRNRFTTRFEYHHGCFDGIERDFCGFGRVDQFDTEIFENLDSSAANNAQASHVPPSWTKTWYHTGQRSGPDDVATQYQKEYYREPGLTDSQISEMYLHTNDLPNVVTLQDNTTVSHVLSVDEVPEASRALKGSILRQEIYALDAPLHDLRPYAVSDHPYAVSENRYSVTMTQPMPDIPNAHGAFFSSQKEAVDYHYERRIFPVGTTQTGVLQFADPRVTHEITLKTNIFGQILEAVSISYGRRHKTEADEPFQDQLTEQFNNTISLMTNAFTNPISTDFSFRLPVSADTSLYEVVKYDFGSGDPLITNIVSLVELQNQLATAADGLHDLPLDDIANTKAVNNAPYRRLISRVRNYYRSDDLSKVLPLNTLESHAILSQTFGLSANPTMFKTAFVDSGKLSEPNLEDILLNQCKYVHSEGDQNWWTPSGQVFYSPDQNATAVDELNFAKQHFFVARRYRDPFHSATLSTETIVEYDDYDLVVVQTTDPVGNMVTVGERNVDPKLPLVTKGLDYRVLQPKIIMDSNRNRLQIAFDILGMVSGTAYMGKPEETIGDNLSDFESDPSGSTIATYFADPITNASTLLGSATQTLVYDLYAFYNSRDSDNPQPVMSSAISREIHMSDLKENEVSPMRINFSYSDGFGRQIQAKVQAAPGPVPQRDSAGKIVVGQDGSPAMTQSDFNPRWVGNGWTIFDNKGNPVRTYEPFFSDTHKFEFELILGVSPVVFYDPLGRTIATLSPNHTWTKVVFDPWKYTSWRPSDTVHISKPEEDLDVGYFFSRLETNEYLPTWYDQRIYGDLGPQERVAATKSAANSDSTSTAYFDPLGRVFFGIGIMRSTYSNSPAGAPSLMENKTFKVTYDLQGRQLAMFDSRNRKCCDNNYSVEGNIMHQVTMDSGERWTIRDVVGKVLYTFNSRGFQGRTIYDQLRRPQEEYLKDGSSPEVMLSRYVYGDNALMTNFPDSQNGRSKVIAVFDQSGKVTTDRYDFKGQLLRTTRQLSVFYSTILNWANEEPLEADIFDNNTTFDAYGRAKEVTLWDKTTVQFHYSDGGAIKGIDATLQGTEKKTFVSNIEYNARGQRTKIEYGNQVVKTYEYDRLTTQLRNMVAKRPAGEIQNLSYVFDASGNVVYIKDASQQTNFFRNEVVTPDNQYTYDSLGQMIEATGREHLGQNTGSSNSRTPPGAFDNFQNRNISQNDSGAMASYTERAIYDTVGNILSLQHEGTAASPGWTRTYGYDEIATDNRLTSTTIGNATDTYNYSGNAGLHGNMTSMPHLSLMEWDFKDQLRSTAKTIINNGGAAAQTWYCYEGSGSRVRKVTEGQTVAGQTSKRMSETIYLGALEIFRQYENDGATISLQRTSVMFGDDEDAVARVYTRTMGTEQGVPAQIIRYQLTNHIHSTSMELDEQANIASYEEYTPFGSTSYYAVDNELEIPKIRRWNNKERDDESGFYYFGARYYAPWITRWINADPGGFVDGLNVFSYVSNNPIKNKDPTGNFSEEVEVFLDELIPYAYKVKDKASLGKNIQKDHTIAQNLLKKILGPIFQKLYDKEKDLTVAVETGKGEWHTIKSVLERAIREKIVAGDITELNEVVYETVNVLKSANVEVGRAAELISSQYIGILDQLGNMFSQLKPDQAGELFQLMESGDDAKLIQRVEEFAQESKAALDPEKARAFAEGQNQLTRILKGASQEEGVIQKGEQVLENLVEGAKPILEKGAEVAAESGGGKLFARGGGIALGVLFFMLAKNDDQRVDAAISGTAGVLMEGPHVAKALGGGMMVGQGLESVFNVSDVSMHAGLWANQKMRENGFKEDAANAVGLYVTAEMTIPAIPIAIGKKVAPLAQKAGKGLRNFHW